MGQCCSYTIEFLLTQFEYFFFQLHAVSRTQQGKQREPSVNTLRSLLSAFLEALRVE